MATLKAFGNMIRKPYFKFCLEKWHTVKFWFSIVPMRRNSMVFTSEFKITWKIVIIDESVLIVVSQWRSYGVNTGKFKASQDQNWYSNIFERHYNSSNYINSPRLQDKSRTASFCAGIVCYLMGHSVDFLQLGWKVLCGLTVCTLIWCVLLHEILFFLLFYSFIR